MANDDIINIMAMSNLEEAEILASQPDRQFHIRDDPFNLSDNAFVREYRLSKVMVNKLIDYLQPLMVIPTRSLALDVKVNVDPINELFFFY